MVVRAYVRRSGRVLLGLAAGAVIAIYTLGSSAHAFSGLGAGTSGNPYRITNCQQLQEIENDLGASYILTNDIDCSDTVNWNGGEGFQPIGATYPDFTGVFDGQNFTIKSLYINRTDATPTALFGNIDHAVIKNVHLRGGSVTTDNTAVYSGTLVSAAYNSDISNCSSTTSLSSGGGGGIVGFITASTLSKCWYSGNLSLSDDRYAGGIFALSTDSTISDLYTTGSMTARGGIAGVVGNHTDISNVYSDADVTFNGSVFELGGLFGSIDGVVSPTTAANIFFAGSVNSATAPGIGGAIGSLEGGATVSGVYYDAFLCNCSTGIGATSGGSGTATAINTANATPAYFKGNSTNPPLGSWNFTDVWQSNAGTYPTLRNQPRTDSSTADSNGDGIADSAQPNISGYVNNLTGKKVTIDVGENCQITSSDIKRESSLPVSDPAYEYANGLLDFAADCPSPGYTTTIKLYYYDVSKGSLVVRKYNPNSKAFFNLTGTYGANTTETVIDGHSATVVTYQITDGGDLDMDRQANGAISDPVGLASLVVGAPNTGLEKLPPSK